MITCPGTFVSHVGSRWKVAIEKALAQYKDQTIFQVATLDSTRTDGILVPRVRSQVFRSFLEDPKKPTLPLLLSSTDIRTPKVTQLNHSSKSEIVWWFEGPVQQYRILADVYIVPHAKHPAYSHFEETLRKIARGEIVGSGLEAFKESDWESRRVDLFKSMSPKMKASWCRPVPGSVLQGGEEEAKKWPTKIVEPNAEEMAKEQYEEAKRNWEIALGNFALFVVDPFEVDFVDLHEPPDRRWLFKKKVSGAEEVVWEEVDLVP